MDYTIVIFSSAELILNALLLIILTIRRPAKNDPAPPPQT